MSGLNPAGAHWPPPGLRQLVGRVITLPARVLRSAEGHLTCLLPPTHPYAGYLARAAPGWQLAFPFTQLTPCDAQC